MTGRMRQCRVVVAGVVLALALLRGARAQERAAFTIVALPDTQRYSEKFPGTFLCQAGWIAAERERESIVFVTHLGDLVEHRGELKEWQRADRAMRILDGVVPYSACIGNHDLGTTNAFAFFGPARYAGRSGYLGAAPNGLSHAQLVAAGGYRLLHLNLVYAPDAATLDWARGVVAAYAESPAIISTHDNLGLAARTANGEALWNAFVSRTPQIFLVLNGHTHGEYWQVSTNVAGGRVIEILSDYQENLAGGEGDLRLLRFDLPRNRLEVETYSPLLDRANTNVSSRFGFDMAYGATIQVRAPVGRGPSGFLGRKPEYGAAPAPTAPVAAPDSLPPPPAGVTRLRFRQGVAGYTGSVDTELREAQAGMGQGEQPTISVDGDDPAGSGKRTQVLLRFDALFGAGTNTLPPAATIVAATLRLQVVNDGAGLALHRLLLPWDAAATWERLQDGVAADGREAVEQPELRVGRGGVGVQVPMGPLALDVTASLRAWQGGAANCGWVMLPLPAGSDGTDFASAEAADVRQRPELTVDYR